MNEYTKRKKIKNQNSLNGVSGVYSVFIENMKKMSWIVFQKCHDNYFPIV